MGKGQDTNVRVWRVNLNSTAGIMVRPDTLTLIGGEDNFIHMDEGNVTICATKLNITTDPVNIKKGILFSEQLGFLQMLPSNITMPISNVGINIPGQGMIAGIGKNLAALSAVAG